MKIQDLYTKEEVSPANNVVNRVVKSADTRSMKSMITMEMYDYSVDILVMWNGKKSTCCDVGILWSYPNTH